MPMQLPLAVQLPLPFAAAERYAEAALAASVGPWPGVGEHRDLRFGAEPWQIADLFAPADASAVSGDVMVFFHGGGWTNGYKEWCGLMAPGLAARGVTLVVPAYRLAPAARWPACLDDALAAVAQAGALAARIGITARRIFVGGHSAGGQIALMTALRSDLWAASGIRPGTICGCLPISGILDLHHPAPLPGSLEARVYDMVLATPDDDRAASPLHWLDRLGVPLALCWGERDSERVRLSNAEAVARLAGSRFAPAAQIWPEDHFGTHLALGDPGHEWYGLLDDMRMNPA